MELDAQGLIRDALESDFVGWDFSDVEERWAEEPTSWNYKEIIEQAMVKAGSMLDMGTGGGEFLAKLSTRPLATFATESYEPNIPVASRNLGPLGIEVREFQKDEALPFDSEQFDLIINRHESFSPSEVSRILKPGGLFVTQQVGGRDNELLNVALGSDCLPEHFDWSLQLAVSGLKEAGFELLTEREEFPATKFHDIGAVVFFLRTIPWQIPDFTVERYKAKLLELHDIINQQGPFKVNSHRFLVVAMKPTQ